MRFRVLAVVSVKMSVFWAVAPCSLVGVYRFSEVLAACTII